MGGARRPAPWSSVTARCHPVSFPCCRLSPALSLAGNRGLDLRGLRARSSLPRRPPWVPGHFTSGWTPRPEASQDQARLARDFAIMSAQQAPGGGRWAVCGAGPRPPWAVAWAARCGPHSALTLLSPLKDAVPAACGHPRARDGDQPRATAQGYMTWSSLPFDDYFNFCFSLSFHQAPETIALNSGVPQSTQRPPDLGVRGGWGRRSRPLVTASSSAP